MREGSLAVGSNREPQIPEMGRVRQHLPTMGTLCRIDARGSPATEIGVDRHGGPPRSLRSATIDVSFHLPGVPRVAAPRFRGR